MNNRYKLIVDITPSTYIRHLNVGIRRKLSDFLDPQDRWKDVIVSIQKPNGGPRYTQLHVRRFEGLILQGKSPTMELLNDWGTTNCTVGDFVDILKSHNLLAPASLLLPDTVKAVTSGGRQLEYPAVVTHYSNSPTTIVRDPAPEEPVSLSQIMSAPVRTEPQPNVSTEEREPYSKGFSSFCYHELMEVTGNFDDRPISAGGKRLGEGGFGTVYKGFINNTPVAVKKLSPMEEISVEELQGQFNQEVQTLKSLKHDNLVDMVGFSCDGQYPCLVYSYMENGSLLDRLACLDDSSPLSWRRRCLVCLGTARGLDYLHSNHHVHRDVKSANILLDENFVAKISDFGLTRASAKQTSTTMMTERIMGTCAYMAPEALRGEITPKSDIFSFGVVLLEILSGLPPVDENREPQLLMEMRYDIDDEDEDLTLEDFLDKKMKDWELSQVESTYSLACSCLHDRKLRRPLIKQVLSEIEEVVKSISPK